MPNKMKGLLFGGNFTYRITKDKKYFIKYCMGGKEWIIKEYNNLINFWNKLDIENLKLAEPVRYSEDKEYLVTKYIEGIRLSELLNPKIYYIFGKKLKEFHQKGFIHGHFDITDIIYKNGMFILVDVPFFNERSRIHDLVTLKISLNMHILKKPWKIYLFKKCEKEFLKGYQLENLLEFKMSYRNLMKSRTNLLLRKGYTLKGYLLKIIFKIC